MGISLLEMVRRREIQRVTSRTVLPLVVFLGATFLSFGVGQLPWFLCQALPPIRAQLGGLGIFILSAAAFLLTCQLVKEVRWLERLTWIFLGLGAIYIFGATYSSALESGGQAL